MSAYTDLIERLLAIPVWMVHDMSPGWQDHGAAAYLAADAIAKLEAERDALLAALEDVIDRFTGAFPASEAFPPITAARAAIAKATHTPAGN